MINFWSYIKTFNNTLTELLKYSFHLQDAVIATKLVIKLSNIYWHSSFNYIDIYNIFMKNVFKIYLGYKNFSVIIRRAEELTGYRADYFST